MTKKLLPGLLAALAAMSIAPIAHAHTGGTPTMSFIAGFSHPLGGLDHLLAMIAVGLWSGQIGGRTIWLAPLGFMSFMAVGGTLGILGTGFPFVELGIVASVLIFGVLVTMATKPPAWLGIAAVFGFALFHGYAHGAEMHEDASGLHYAAGFVLATGLLHLLGIAMARGLQHIKLTRVVQGLGAGIVVGGFALLMI
jgi:urease accessory protein